MSSTIGNKIKLQIFGESHGRAIGGVIDGLPPGEALDFDRLLLEMARRAPGKDPAATTRREPDFPNILSGLQNGITTGTPLAFTIENTNTRSDDYLRTSNLLRPSHADYTAQIRYGGHADIRGGGHFSGRLTAPLVFAGAAAKQILSRRGITVGGQIYSAGEVTGKYFESCKITAEQLEGLAEKAFPTLGNEAEMRGEIDAARKDGDSLGGICEIAAAGIPAGIGSPIFQGVESEISRAIFGIPAVKGIEFGQGFEITKIRGSVANDSFYFDDDTVRTRTNNSGGIQGGITNGMPIIFRVAFKPTPSVALEQDTIDYVNRQEARLSIKGRHDPFIALRGLVAAEAAAALVILDLMETQGCL